jgi:MinD superfamily P-loop ATPase
MPYMITEKCIECGCCQMFCENGAAQETDITYVIDETKCQECGTCLTYCPIDGAIIKREISLVAVK